MAATITLVTFVERVACLKAISDVTWHRMAYMTLNARYVHTNIPMPLFCPNMYSIVIKMLMVMSQRCHCIVLFQAHAIKGYNIRRPRRNWPYTISVPLLLGDIGDHICIDAVLSPVHSLEIGMCF